jgi:hypothetical protein
VTSTCCGVDVLFVVGLALFMPDTVSVSSSAGVASVWNSVGVYVSYALPVDIL